jgi:iron-sulfur cluster assembly protein
MGVKMTITTKAADKVKEILAREEKGNWGLRIGLQQGCCSGSSFMLALDEKASDFDTTLEVEGLKVFISQQDTPELEGVSLDYVEEDERSGFLFHNPKAKNHGCGCGH